MKYMRLFSLATLLLAICTTSVWADESEVPAVPATPAAVEKVVYARSFALEEGYKFEWRKEQPLLKEGTVLVLKVDPALVYPRQVAEPVLYVGDQTAERVNIGHKSGHVVAIVPGKIDLKKTLIWFGTPELPEQVDAKTINAERQMAKRAGVKPLATKQIDDARKKGGENLKVKDRYELRRDLATVVKEYAPDETELADGLLVPRD